MEKEVWEKYAQDGWHLFPLHKVPGKGNAVKGEYGTPKGWNDVSKTYKYSPNKIWAGVPPNGMVAIDWDMKNDKRGLESFKKLQKDLGVSLETVVTTPSGGGHAYTWIDLDKMEEGKSRLAKMQDKYPDIDFQSHGSEFVVLGGQEIEGYGEYEFEQFDYFVNPKTDFSKLTLRGDRYKEGEGYNDIDELEHVSERPTYEEVQTMLSKLNPDCDYSEWQQIAMALNNWDLNGKQGLRLFTEWSLTSKKFIELEGEETIRFNCDEVYHRSIANSPSFYKKMFGMVNKKDNRSFKSKIAEAKSRDDLLEVADAISNSTISNADRLKYVDELVTKNKALGNENEKVMWKNAVKKAQKEVDPAKEVRGNTKIFLCNNRYVVQHNSIIEEDVSSNFLKIMLQGDPFNYTLSDVAVLTHPVNIKPISEVKHIPNYLIKEQWEVKLGEYRGTQLQPLLVSHNPLYEIEKWEYREDIIDDFYNKIWNGKASDVIKLIALSIRFKEKKLNRLMLVAPSNSGKSELFTMLNFQKITMQRLLLGLRAEKGIGSPIINGIKASGLLLIDEANKVLEPEIKDIDKEIQLDQFGAGGGTQILPLHFTGLTSTHSTATRNNSDELYNRFVQVELSPSEMQHTVVQSPLFVADRDIYSSVIKGYALTLFKECLTSKDYKESDLKYLQDRYRLPVNNDLDDLMYDISTGFIEQTKLLAREKGDIVFKTGKYYYRRKTDVTDYFKDRLGEIPSIDVGKYTEKVLNHFKLDANRSRATLKIDGKPVKYWEVDLKPYDNGEYSVVSEFDDLDDELE